MPLDLNGMLKNFKTLSDNELEKILEAVQKEVEFRKLKEFVDYIPNFLTEDLATELIKDGESLGLACSSNKPSSQWLSPVNEPYIFNDVNPIHHAKDINNFPAICKVRDLINADPRLGASIDSCLILKYPNSSTSISPHADNEESIDQSQPLCNVSLGTSRTIEFMTSSGHRPVTSVTMHHRSLTVMKAGTQSILKHAVRPETRKGDTRDETRWCFSFRARGKRISLPATTPDLDKTPILFSPTGSSEDTLSPLALRTSSSLNVLSASTARGVGVIAAKPPSRRICLLAGDSYAARLDPEKLGKRSLVVESVAKGGAKMHQVMGQLGKFHEFNKNIIVEKLFISVGTNDIRYCRDKGVSHLLGKLKSLCALIKDLFPDCKVYFQSLIPLPCLHERDWLTNSNVIDFNSLIFNECKFRRFHIIDAFSAFRDPQRVQYAPYPELRNHVLFEGHDIHPSARRGMGVLARLYLRALHSRYFDPFVWQ